MRLMVEFNSLNARFLVRENEQFKKLLVGSGNGAKTRRLPATPA